MLLAIIAIVVLFALSNCICVTLGVIMGHVEAIEILYQVDRDKAWDLLDTYDELYEDKDNTKAAFYDCIVDIASDELAKKEWG